MGKPALLPALRGIRITHQRFMTALNLAVACVTEQVNSTTVHPSHARCVRKALIPKKGMCWSAQFALTGNMQIRQGLEGVRHAILISRLYLALPPKMIATVNVWVENLEEKEIRVDANPVVKASTATHRPSSVLNALRVAFLHQIRRNVLYVTLGHIKISLARLRVKHAFQTRIQTLMVLQNALHARMGMERTRLPEIAHV